MNYKTSSHSKYSLNYHLILSTKYRKKCLTNEMLEDIKNIFKKLEQKYGVILIDINHDKDHIHALINSKLTTNLSTYINVLKSFSSRLLRTKYSHIRNIFWKQSFWSSSYFIVSSGGASIEELKKYIKGQGD